MTTLRLVLGAIGLTNLVIGATAALAPRAFYDDFPLGAAWVGELPPYNQHLTTDVGAFHLDFGVADAVAPTVSLVLVLALPLAALRLTDLDA